MKRDLLAAPGALAFALLSFGAAVLADPPGGSYSAKDAASFVRHGHHAAVFASLYMMVLAAVGLVLLLARLRAAIQSPLRAAVFWALGVAAATAWVVGYALVVAVPIATAYGGRAVVPAPALVYTLAEAGWIVLFGAGGLLLGAALLTFAAGAVAVPAWVRWATLVGGLGAVGGAAWFPFFLVLLWALVLGVWLAVSARTQSAHAAAVTA